MHLLLLLPSFSSPLPLPPLLLLFRLFFFFIISFSSRSLIETWQKILLQHRSTLLNSVEPRHLINSLQAEGFTEAEAALVLAPAARDARVSKLCHFLGNRPALAMTFVAALRRTLLPFVAQAFEEDLKNYDLHELHQ